MSQELRERLVRIEEQASHQGESLGRIEEVLEDLVGYVARNEDNRKNIKKNRRRIEQIERRQDEQESWLESRIWFVTTVMGALLIAVQIVIKMLF